MLEVPEIRISKIPDDGTLCLDIEPSPEELVQSATQARLESLPGVLSVEAKYLGSLVIKPANPFFSLDELSKCAKLVTTNYFEQKQVGQDGLSKHFNFEYIDGNFWADNYIAPNQFQVARFNARETDDQELCIGFNRRLSGDLGFQLCVNLMANVRAVFLAEMIDKDYNLRIALTSFLAEQLPKEDLAETVIQYINEYR